MIFTDERLNVFVRLLFIPQMSPCPKSWAQEENGSVGFDPIRHERIHFEARLGAADRLNVNLTIVYTSLQTVADRKLYVPCPPLGLLHVLNHFCSLFP